MRNENLSVAVAELAEVMGQLRQECPWDRVQTHASLKRYLIEECHEVLEALDAEDPVALKEELGDLLFQIWFHAEIASESLTFGFDLADVLVAVREKLLRRHPHVFEPTAIKPDAELVQKSWEERKVAEGRHSRLDGIPPLLPALAAADSLQRKAAGVGFEWPEIDGAVDKVKEEIEEWLEATSRRSGDEAPSPEESEELGDLLFSLVNVARYRGLNAEDALRGCCQKFRRRFQHIEAKARAGERGLEAMSLDEMDALWDEAKSQE